MGVRVVTGLSLLLGFAALAAGEAGGRPGPLPEGVVAAWRKAGAAPGWMGKDVVGLLEFRETAERGSAGVPVCHCPDCRRDFFPPQDSPAPGPPAAPATLACRCPAPPGRA